MLTIHKQTVLIHPILDEFYDDDPNHDRSSGLVASKGLVSKAPGTTVAPRQGNTPTASATSSAAEVLGVADQGPRFDEFDRSIVRTQLRV
jgi:glutamine amidotransferase